MSKQVCEIKSVRENFVKEVSEKMFSEKRYYDSSSLFKILSDFNRIRILHALMIEELCVCELSLLLDMSQSAISHQLRLLRANDIVRFRKKEKRVFYSLNDCKVIEFLEKVCEIE
jgi:ArsR family transcriptional regulator